MTAKTSAARCYRNPQPTKPGDVWRIDIHADRKVRYIDRGSPSTHDRIGANAYPDPWMLLRSAVPALTDAEWYADPWADVRPVACCASCGQENGSADPGMCEVCSRVQAQDGGNEE